MPRRHLAAVLVLALTVATPAPAAELRVSAAALERTARQQLFNGPDGRFYLRGDLHSACGVYVANPRFAFRDDRIVVHVETHARLGTAVRGSCLGLSLNTNAVVSLVPVAEGESIGFREARIEQMSDNHELNFLLAPFLSGRLPRQLRLNAADLLRKLLSSSRATTGYALTLTRLKLHSLLVDHDHLVLDADAGLDID